MATSDRIAEAGASLNPLMERVSQPIKENVHRLQNGVHTAAVQLEKSASTHPFITIAISAVAGALLGAVIARRL